VEANSRSPSGERRAEEAKPEGHAEGTEPKMPCQERQAERAEPRPSRGGQVEIAEPRARSVEVGIEGRGGGGLLWLRAEAAEHPRCPIKGEVHSKMGWSEEGRAEWPIQGSQAGGRSK